MESVYEECVPKWDWWQYNVETFEFKSKKALEEFVDKCSQICYEYEANSKQTLTQTQDIYREYKKQQQSFEVFFSTYNPDANDYGIENINCSIRARILRNLLENKLQDDYPGIRNKICIANSVMGHEVPIENLENVEITKILHIRKFCPHLCPFLKFKIRDQDAAGYIIFEMPTYFEKPVVIFEGKVQRFDGKFDYKICQVINNYVVIKKYERDQFLFMFYLYVGGNLVNFNKAFKLSCLPLVPVTKYRISQGQVTFFLLGNLVKSYFKLFLCNNIQTEKMESNEKHNRLVSKISVDYILNRGKIEKDLDTEKILEMCAENYGETVEEFMECLTEIAIINRDKEFAIQFQNYCQKVDEMRKYYVENLLPKLHLSYH